MINVVQCATKKKRSQKKKKMMIQDKKYEKTCPVCQKVLYFHCIITLSGLTQEMQKKTCQKESF